MVMVLSLSGPTTAVILQAHLVTLSTKVHASYSPGMTRFNPDRLTGVDPINSGKLPSMVTLPTNKN